jgi:predicted RNA polymerase sigma factor
LDGSRPACGGVDGYLRMRCSPIFKLGVALTAPVQSFTPPYAHNAIAYCCDAAGLEPDDPRAFTGAPDVVPQGDELAARLSSVLEVVYLIFNEGYSATAGDDWMRPALCEDALRLGRILARLAPREPEVHGLVALMEIQASRAAARTGPGGEPILLADQNRARWDQLLIRRGLAALERAEALIDGKPGPYVLQAAIAACHARARRFEDTDRERIAWLYEHLAEAMASPVVEPNRAVALSMAFGPETGLALLDQLMAFPAMQNYHLLPSVRGDFLTKLGRHAEARVEFERAASLTRNERERTLLLDRAAACDQPVRTDHS